MSVCVGATDVAGRAAKSAQRAGIGYTASQQSGATCSAQVGRSGRWGAKRCW